ncbi:amidase [Halalkalicoccus subterraneus]|uniref:amidase n=1 Tax=Halalkalicoccus subterraneus TaxID=2675002 RepID=UPI000EFD8764|nr:amidase [Halalkalicoccus subterraneus]
MKDIEPPAPDDLERYAAVHHIKLTETEREEFAAVAPGLLEAYERLEEIESSAPIVPAHADRANNVPTEDDDPLNAFVRRCSVSKNESGLLEGYDVGLKDSISLAGIEMTCGSALFSGYVPSTDATIATRLLKEGATITGKLNMENMAFSGSGEMSAHGPVPNPRDPEYLAGGSSSGSAAAVVSGDVDIAIGTDQAGSVRIPASWSGCVGHKPTYGLVPYTGIVGLGRSFDHAGPLARSVTDCARTLEAIAGADGLDPRQGAVPTESYSKALTSDPADLTIGVLKEGFDHAESEAGVDETVTAALEDLADTGAKLRDISVPMHRDGLAIWNGIANEETAATIAGEGIGHFGNGYYDTELMAAFGQARRERANEFPPTVKFVVALGEYLTEEYHGRYYAKAQNLSRDLATSYNAALAEVDVLAMPTTPQTAHKRLENPSRLQILERAVNMLANTSPFDVTGHPALSVPAGTSEGLPVGLMFVGEVFDDATVLQAGDAFERCRA